MQSSFSSSEALQKFWHYSSFRPGQLDIINAILAGRDTCAVMPTGGGKSLCYQLPAAMDSRRTAVVVSPLIALMQDQVAQLRQMGISAALINSSQSYAERQETIGRAVDAEYRLLYLSPESIVLEATLEWLRKVPVSFFAIDEAHCISEWGHDFRPEYRQLNGLRGHFPDCPVSAFTAGATQRVRHDIVEQLSLRDPFKHLASFYRPNLRYSAQRCTADSQGQLLLQAIHKIGKASIIVYVPTIARVQDTVEFLEQNAIPAIGYHGKMDSVARRNSQERWMRDEVRVIVCTIAFGLGIDKPSVRAVIHLALPKGLEQFYQEAGRAGRDGLPADCILLWQKRDAGTQGFFNNQISDAQERERAWQRYRDIRGFADSATCRQFQICRHFGESPKWERCENCDVCKGLPDWLRVPRSSSLLPARSRNRSAPQGRLNISTPVKETLDLLAKGHSLEKIAAIRGRSVRSVVSIVAKLIERGEYSFREEWLDPRKYRMIADACARLGHEFLKPLKETLPDEITYDEIKLVVSNLRAREPQPATT